jgi:hypothetical protein
MTAAAAPTYMISSACRVQMLVRITVKAIINKTRTARNAAIGLLSSAGANLRSPSVQSAPAPLGAGAPSGAGCLGNLATAAAPDRLRVVHGLASTPAIDMLVNPHLQRYQHRRPVYLRKFLATRRG